MKLTESRLRQIIREEIEQLTLPGMGDDPAASDLGHGSESDQPDPSAGQASSSGLDGPPISKVIQDLKEGKQAGKAMLRDVYDMLSGSGNHDIDELIQKLSAVKSKHGDIAVIGIVTDNYEYIPYPIDGMNSITEPFDSHEDVFKVFTEDVARKQMLSWEMLAHDKPEAEAKVEKDIKAGKWYGEITGPAVILVESFDW